MDSVCLNTEDKIWLEGLSSSCVYMATHNLPEQNNPTCFRAKQNEECKKKKLFKKRKVVSYYQNYAK